MASKKQSSKQKKFFARHRYLKYFLIGILVIALLITLWSLFTKLQTDWRQSRLEPFYNTKDLPKTGRLGEIVRQEPLNIDIPGGSGVRVLYRTQRADGSPTFSSGMILIPNTPSRTADRPVVAWAHGTLGLGDSCAPTRTPNPVSDIAWVSNMLKNGWVITATDYAGFGTPGTQGYLVGKAEANDVLNSVRAARNLPQAKAGSNFVVWGHSQGGNSALFTASRAASYAPELRLAGTVASAPAAELVALLNEQYGTLADWVIGPLIAASWPATNPELKAADVLTKTGLDNYQRIGDKCIPQAVISGLLRNSLKQKIFSKNPDSVPAWREMAQQQSAPYLPSSQPLMVVESKTDKVVLPATTALYIQQACSSGSNLASLWIDNVPHQDIPDKTAQQIIPWIADRFAGKPLDSSCADPLPVQPATVP